MTRNDWIATVAVVVPLLVLSGAIVRVIWRGYRIARADELAELARIREEEQRTFHDPCAVEGCGHARGGHYQRRDRSRGACLDRECACTNYTADRPSPVYDHQEVLG